MARITVFVAQSADVEAVNSFLSSLLVLLLQVNSNDTKKFKVDFKNWVVRSSGVLKQLKIQKEFTKIANTYQLNSIVTEEDAIVLGKTLKKARVLLDKDVTVSQAQLNLYRDIANSLATDSQSAWNRIEKNVSMLRNPKFNQIFIPERTDVVETVSIDKAVKKLKELATKLTGRPDKPFLSPTKIAELRPTHAELLLEYFAYRREINTIIKAEISKFVRSSGKDLVPLTELKEYLRKKNIVNDLPIGFLDGQIDEKGKMYTKEGRELDKIPYGTVSLNPKYDPETDNTYVLRNIEDDVRYRTLTMNDANKSVRHAKVKEFFKTESSSRQKWLTDLQKVGSREQILASMVELLYQTACRVGDKDNATKGEPTYGLTTLQVRFLTFNPNNVQFNYSGKKLAEQEHIFKTTTIEGKKIREVLKSLTSSKQPSDLVFTFKGKRITRPMVNNYLRSHGIELTAHRFRQLAGTKATMGILHKSPFKAKDAPKQSVVDKWVKEELKKVGSILHHRTGTAVTGMTAVKSYINPEVLQEFYTKLNLRIPSWIPSNTK